MALRERDALDAFLEVLHGWIGHARTADYIGQPSGDTSACKLCHPEVGPLDYESDEQWQRRKLMAGVRP
jgi:hypothetical protein